MENPTHVPACLKRLRKVSQEKYGFKRELLAFRNLQ